MSTSMSKCIGGLSASLKIEEENKQGIVTILGSDPERNTALPASIRRTLAADISSKKRIAQNGFHPMEKTPSFLQFSVDFVPHSSSSPEEEEAEYEKGKETEGEGPGQDDIWSSIVYQKKKEDASRLLPPPYVHPLSRRSSSSLSEKSLLICTESLGSETGSDGFSSYPPSETGETEEYKEEETELQEIETMTLQAFDAANFNSSVPIKKSPPLCFPPPLSSLAHRDGASLQMRNYRDNGRLVLEAVSVPSQNNFAAHRQDGRLVLTFVNIPDDHHNEAIKADPDEKEENLEEMEEDFGESEEESEEDMEHEEDGNGKIEEEEEVKETEDLEILMEKESSFVSGFSNVERVAVIMNKPIGIANRSKNFNPIIEFEEEEEAVEENPVAKSLPPRPRVSQFIPSSQAGSITPTKGRGGVASLNVYQNNWKTKPSSNTTLVINPLTLHQQNQQPSKKPNSKFLISKDFKQQHVLVLEGNRGDFDLGQMVQSCKDSRRSFMFWEPHCIAT